MELIKLIEDVSRQRTYLEILRADTTINADSLEICNDLLSGITRSLDELSTDWIPIEPARLNRLLIRTFENSSAARVAVNEGILSVDPSKADHLLRLKLSFLSIAALDFMFEKLVLAIAEEQKPETVN